MSAVFDLQARRDARPRDRDSLISNLADGASSLQTMFSSWPFRHLKQSDIDGAERNLLVLRAILAELRGYVPLDDEARS